jgi:putative glycerol-1-phosphate prenyltransferase
MHLLREWRTIVKLDPGRTLSDERLEEVCSWPADAIVVGGSGGYGAAEVAALLKRLRRQPLPVALEVSDAAALSPGFDLYFVPVVLNSGGVEWVVGRQQEALKQFGRFIKGRRVFAEGYCVLNPQATVAQVANARADLGVDDIVAYAQLAQDLFNLPIFYLEYSGAYGSPEVVDAVSAVLDSTLLWYGGGISAPEQAEEMHRLADAIVIGNAIYEGGSPLARVRS